MKRGLLLMLGFGLVILGVALMIRDWQAVVTVFKGVSGGVLAVGGLIVLAMLKH